MIKLPKQHLSFSRMLEFFTKICYTDNQNTAGYYYNYREGDYQYGNDTDRVQKAAGRDKA